MPNYKQVYYFRYVTTCHGACLDTQQSQDCSKFHIETIALCYPCKHNMEKEIMWTLFIFLEWLAYYFNK